MSHERKIGAVVLELLKGAALTTTELFVDIAMQPFRISYKGHFAPLRGKKFSIRESLTKIEQEYRDRERFYNFLASLRRDGLISVDSSTKNKRWIISTKGIALLKKLEMSPRRRYLKIISREVIVISYDIPEKYRVYRSWLRSVLKILDFKMLHKSVWISRTEIPETLLLDLSERGITPFIHIFTIGKKGSLVQIL